MLRFQKEQASIRHIWAVARKELNHIVRDRSTLFLVLFTPTLVLLLMAYALTVDLKHIPIAVLDLDRSQTITDIHSADHGRAGPGYLCLCQRHGRDQCHADARADQGGGHYCAGFCRVTCSRCEGIPLQVIIDGTEPASGNFAVQHIEQRTEEFIGQALTSQLQAQRSFDQLTSAARSARPNLVQPRP